MEGAFASNSIFCGKERNFEQLLKNMCCGRRVCVKFDFFVPFFIKFQNRRPPESTIGVIAVEIAQNDERNGRPLTVEYSTVGKKIYIEFLIFY